MNTKMMLSAAAVGALLAAAPAMAQNSLNGNGNNSGNNGAAATNNNGAGLGGNAGGTNASGYHNAGYNGGNNNNGNDGKHFRQAQQTVVHAEQAVAQMDRSPHLRHELKNAHGIYIVPNYSQGGFIVGGSGGNGVLLIHDANGHWSAPSFYHLGGISFGAQAGGSSGPVAFLLMTNNAVKQFMANNNGNNNGNNNNIQLNAQAGLTVAAWSSKGEASSGAGDVIVWSNQKGAFAGAKVGGKNISWDAKLTRAYYHNAHLSQNAVFYNKLHTSADQKLQRELPQA